MVNFILEKAGRITDKGKPAVRLGRKAKGPVNAGSPVAEVPGFKMKPETLRPGFFV